MKSVCKKWPVPFLIQTTPNPLLIASHNGSKPPVNAYSAIARNASSRSSMMSSTFSVPMDRRIVSDGYPGRSGYAETDPWIQTDDVPSLPADACSDTVQPSVHSPHGAPRARRVSQVPGGRRMHGTEKGSHPYLLRESHESLSQKLPVLLLLQS